MLGAVKELVGFMVSYNQIEKYTYFFVFERFHDCSINYFIKSTNALKLLNARFF
jgi:hypothetical protein